MKWSARLLILAFALPRLGHGEPRSAARDREALVAIEQAWLAGSSDAATLARVLADDFVHVLPTGDIVGKDAHVRWATSHPPPPGAQRRLDGLEVRVYGDVAVVTGSVIRRAGDAPERRNAFTDVFVRRGDRWQAVSAQETLPVAVSDELTLVTDEADAALAILAAEAAGKTPAADDWRRLFASEGYRLLARREASMKRAFSDEDFRRFLGARDTIAAAPALARTLAEWRARSLRGAEERAHAYLPANTVLRARVLPVIKPKSNSFVFTADGTRLIFLYLDPKQVAERFENTVAHELHHVGLEAACGEPAAGALPAPVARARKFAGGFGEGFAMLAAAGGPDVHPHAVSPPEDRARWDRDLGHFDGDVRSVERFFTEILDGKITSDEQAFTAAAPFWGVQGAWYTVGWKMAVAIEKKLGRARLLHDECDPVGLLTDYNAVAPTGDAHWSPALIQRLRAR